MQKRDIKTFQRNIDQFYMPSIKACEEIEKFYIFNNIKELPPGTENNQIQDLKNTKTAIYVGASSYQYGTDLLIASYNSLWEKGYRYKLIIVTREAEWRKMYPEGLGYEWLEVHHTSGMDLKQLYEQADCAILPMRKSYYSDLSYSIKLFEYLSYGKPIISNDFEMMGAFVRKYNCGMIYNDEENGLENAIATFYKSREIREKLYKNVIEACNKNLWRERVREIIKDFKELK